MMVGRIGRLVVAGVLLSGMAGCEDRSPQVEQPDASATSIPVVYAVNYPLKYFAERIAGDLAKVVLPVPTGIDPAFWRPKPEIILAFQKADLILLNGAGYAKWIQFSTLREKRLLNTSALFEERYIYVSGVKPHAHGPGETHVHGDIAFTTWLDPTLAMQQAEAIRDGLILLIPKRAQHLDSRLQRLVFDLHKLDDRLREITQEHRDKPLIASHPIYQYFARRYELKIESLHWEPGEIPSDEQWRSLSALLEHYPAKSMIWEGPPLGEVASRLRELGIECIVFRPCANTPGSSDWLTVMNENASRLESGLRASAAP